LEQHPADQATAWSAILPEIAATSLACALVMDIYRGPQGDGWCATLYVRHNSTLYSRAYSVGPETYRTYGWRVVAED
jgi:hypothetical protein